MDADLIVASVLVIALGVAAQWLAWRLRLPTIVLLLAAGVIVGPVVGLLHPSRDFHPLFHPMVSLAVAFILFVGGLNLHGHELRESAVGVKRLILLGVPLSWGFASAAGYWIGQLSLAVATVFGAIMVVTGPTVIMPLLRQSHLNRRTAAYLKWEGIINDPIGALLATIVLQYWLISAADKNSTVLSVITPLMMGAAAGAALGAVTAYGIGFAYRRGWVPEFLKAPVVFALVLSVFALADRIAPEAGLLAVTVMGLVIANMELPSMEEMRRFKEYLTLLLVSSVFVLLTADLRPDIVQKLDWHSVMLVMAMLFLVRPAAGWLSTMGADMSWRDRVLIAWIAPRGIVAAAVAGVFAPALINVGYADGRLLVPLIFAVVFTTILAHGFTLPVLARWLRLSVNPNGVLLVGASPWTTELARMLTQELELKVLLVDASWHRLRAARLAGVRVLYGELLSERIRQSLEINEISCLLAATSNDAYNALVCHHFSNELERSSVFQLAMTQAQDHSSKSVAKPLRGTVAFGESAQYEDLWWCHFQGWRFFKTRLTESYTYEQFLTQCEPECMLIAVVREDATLVFYAAQDPVKPKRGDTLVYYAPDRNIQQPANVRRKHRDGGKQTARAAKKDAAAGAQSLAK